MNDRRYPRMARVNEVVREVLAEELEILSDPRLHLVTITGVEVSPDLKNARVYYSVLNAQEETEEDGDAAAKALESARRHLQAALARQVRMKYVPRLAFTEDPAMRQGSRIEDIIRNLHQGPSGPTERETQGPSGPTERETQGPSGPTERETTQGRE